MTTQRRLASELGLALSTVSQALRGAPGVAPDTRARVLEAAEAAGYVYNRSAAALRSRRLPLVGVSFHDITNPFFASLLASIEEELTSTGLVVVINNHGEMPASQTRFLQAMCEFGAAGVLVSPAAGVSREAIEGFTRRGLVVATVSRDLPGLGADHCGFQDAEGFRAMVAHLVTRGHRRIGMLGAHDRIAPAARKREGYREGMRAAGLDDLIRERDAPGTRIGGAGGVGDLISGSEPCTAVVCFNDLVAIGAYDGLRERGLRPGRDVAVAGCDDVPEASHASPALTTIRYDARQLGAMAARLLCDRMEASEQPRREWRLSPTLVPRESTPPRGAP